MRYVFFQNDPSLEKKRRELIDCAAHALDKARMVRYHHQTGDINVTGIVEMMWYTELF
jgi:activating signal cointegrator complex subunit 3